MKLAMQIDSKNWEERWEARETVNAQVQAAKDPETIKAKQTLECEGRQIEAQAEATKQVEEIKANQALEWEKKLTTLKSANADKQRAKADKQELKLRNKEKLKKRGWNMKKKGRMRKMTVKIKDFQFNKE